MARQPIPLDQIRVASPCHASWDDMRGDDRRRFCGQCHKHVHNLSGMSRDEAEALVHQTEGRMCARFFRRSDGTMLTQDCPVGLRAAWRKSLLLAGAAAVLLIGFLGVVTSVAAGAVGVAWANGWRPRPLVWLINQIDPPPMRGGGEMVMGDICPPDHQPPAPQQ